MQASGAVSRVSNRATNQPCDKSALVTRVTAHHAFCTLRDLRAVRSPCVRVDPLFHDPYALADPEASALISRCGVRGLVSLVTAPMLGVARLALPDAAACGGADDFGALQAHAEW
jgi:hypothetical protein